MQGFFRKESLNMKCFVLGLTVFLAPSICQAVTYIYSYDGAPITTYERISDDTTIERTRSPVKGLLSFDNSRLSPEGIDNFFSSNPDNIQFQFSSGNLDLQSNPSFRSIDLRFTNFDTNKIPSGWSLDLKTNNGAIIKSSGGASGSFGFTMKNSYDSGIEGGEFGESITTTTPDNVWTLEAVTAPSNIVVVTHGWQDNVPYSENGSYLNPIANAFKDRAVAGVRRSPMTTDDIKFFVPSWEEAHTSGNPVLGVQNRYANAFAATEDVGLRLAEDIRKFIEETDSLRKSYFPESPDYKPTIQMIGHSLGTAVNAYAVNSLFSSGITTRQVTLLETPKRPSFAVIGDIGIIGREKLRFASFDDAFFYWKTMPSGSVDYVENFFADQTLTDPSLNEIRRGIATYGQPIAGTVPCEGGSYSSSAQYRCSGREVTGATHTSIWEDYYLGLVESRDFFGDFRSLVIDPTGTAYFNDFKWNPEPLLETLVEAYNSLGDRDLRKLYTETLNPFSGGSTAISEYQIMLGTIEIGNASVTATSNSPSAFAAEFKPDDVLGIMFDYEVLDSTTGILTLTYMGNTIWDVDLEESDSIGDNVFVSTESLFGQGELVWTYDSDEIGSQAIFSDFKLLRLDVRDVAVPEPTTFLLIVTSFICFGITLRPTRSVKGR